MSNLENPYAVDNSDSAYVVCKICDSGHLSHKSVQAYGSALGCLGLILALPSALVIVGLVAIWLIGMFGTVTEPGSSDAVAGGLLAGGLMLPVILVALVPALIGSFLMRTKGVLKCSHCGAVTEAS